MVEANPIEGVLTNVIGTRNVAEAARAFGAALVVMISTDKAVDPASVMGATKRLAESFCQALDLHEARRPAAAGHAVLDGAVRQCAGLDRIGRAAVHASARRRRTADRHPSRGQPLFHDGARGGRAGARGVVDDAAMRGEAADDARGKIFVLDMGEPVKIVDLARQMIRLAGQAPGPRCRDRLYRAAAGREAARGAVPRRRGADPDREPGAAPGRAAHRRLRGAGALDRGARGAGAGRQSRAGNRPAAPVRAGIPHRGQPSTAAGTGRMRQASARAAGTVVRPARTPVAMRTVPAMLRRHASMRNGSKAVAPASERAPMRPAL